MCYVILFFRGIALRLPSTLRSWYLIYQFFQSGARGNQKSERRLRFIPLSRKLPFAVFWGEIFGGILNNTLRNFLLSLDILRS